MWTIPKPGESTGRIQGSEAIIANGNGGLSLAHLSFDLVDDLARGKLCLANEY